jgi:hypothetical protein
MSATTMSATRTDATRTIDVTQRAGAWAIVAGAVGVILTCAFYAVSPSAAALPVPDLDLAAALRGAVAGGATMRVAGAIGIVSDVALAIGALVLMAQQPAASPFARLGWAGIAVSAMIFVVVDSLVGRVLPQLAVLDGPAAGFAGFKRLFDILFLLGTLTLGAADLAVFWDARRAGRRRLGLLGMVAGAMTVLIALGDFAGLDLAQPIGVAVAVASILLLAAGLGLARSLPPAP